MARAASRSALRVALGAALVLLLGLSAVAQEGPVGDKPQLALFADTTKMTIPGLEGIQLPPQAQAVLGGTAGQRALRVNLWTPGSAPANASASLDIPGSLKLGKTLPLEIPTPAAGAPGSGGKDDGKTEIPDFELLRYWGCGAQVGPGQPKSFKRGDLSPAMMARVSRFRTRGYSGLPGFANWTDAMWPNAIDRRPPTIDADAALPGGYQLKSSYAGGVSFEIPAGLSFLEPVSLTAAKNPDLSQAVAFSWKPVPTALGYMAMATGVKDQTHMVIWTSTEHDEDAYGVAFNSSEGVKELVSKGTLMPPTHTECVLPAGIFKGCQGVVLQLIAYGPSFSQTSTTPSVRVHTRSIGMLMLGRPGGFGGGFGGRNRE